MCDHRAPRKGWKAQKYLAYQLCRDWGMRNNQTGTCITGLPCTSPCVREHRPYPESPPRVGYALTPLGVDLLEHVMPLRRWIAAPVDRG
jgi:hypothetical protein